MKKSFLTTNSKTVKPMLKYYFKDKPSEEKIFNKLSKTLNLKKDFEENRTKYHQQYLLEQKYRDKMKKQEKSFQKLLHNRDEKIRRLKT